MGGEFSQALSFPAAGPYTLTYQEAGDGIYTVLLDNTPIVASHLTSMAFSPVSAPFTTTAGTHTLVFRDTDPRDIAGPVPAFIDQVAVTAVPEPASLPLLLTLPGLALLRRLRPMKTFTPSPSPGTPGKG